MMWVGVPNNICNCQLVFLDNSRKINLLTSASGIVAQLAWEAEQMQQN